MLYRYAKKLHNRDQVQVCITRKAPAEWIQGYVLGDVRPIEVEGRKIIELDVVTKSHGILYSITHTMIR